MKCFSEAKKEEIQQKRRATCLAKYGVDHISKVPAIVAKSKATCLSRYDSESTLNIPAVKNERINSLKTNAEEINKKRKKAWTPELIAKTNATRIRTVYSKYGVYNVSQLDEVKSIVAEKIRNKYDNDNFLEKIKNILFSRYNVTNPIKVPNAIGKAKQTSKAKYGVEYYLSSDARREKMVDSGQWVNLELISDFTRYYRKCISVTNKNKAELFSRWNGKCYYSGETLIVNKLLYNDPLYRTIDHKYSIINGYLNGISPEYIGNIDNLCICSKSANRKKWTSND